MYYKIVTARSFFTDLYENSNVFDIPCGTVFCAPEMPKHKPNDSKCMLDKSCIHFADGAFDTMLWHSKLTARVMDFQIYQIQPLSVVSKNRCLDSEGVYQCGAAKIKIIQKQHVDELYDLAVQEYYEHPNKYQNFDIDIDLWKAHKTTICYLKEPYDVLMYRLRQRQSVYTENVR